MIFSVIGQPVLLLAPQDDKADTAIIATSSIKVYFFIVNNLMLIKYHFKKTKIQNLLHQHGCFQIVARVANFFLAYPASSIVTKGRQP